MKSAANDLAIEAADHMSLPCTGASGAHASLDEIGKAATLFRDPVASEADLVAQLRAGTVFCVAIGVTPQPAARDAGERRQRRHDVAASAIGADRGGRGGGHREGGGRRGGGHREGGGRGGGGRR